MTVWWGNIHKEKTYRKEKITHKEKTQKKHIIKKTQKTKKTKRRVKTMRNTRMANKKILKWVASGVMLALLFAIVFAGTLSGAFGVEEGLKNSGVIENNVADATVATPTDASTSGTITYIEYAQKEEALGNDSSNYKPGEFKLTTSDFSTASGYTTPTNNTDNRGWGFWTGGSTGNNKNMLLKVGLDKNIQDALENGIKIGIKLTAVMRGNGTQDHGTMIIHSAEPTMGTLDIDKSFLGISLDSCMWKTLPTNIIVAQHAVGEAWAKEFKVKHEISGTLEKKLDSIYIGFYAVAGGEFGITWDSIKITLTYGSSKTYTINAGENGSVNQSSFTPTAISSSLTATATPNSGYHFTKWSDENTNPSRTFTGYNVNPSLSTYTANFAANTLNVTYYRNLTDSDTTEVGNSPYTYTYGESATALDALEKTDGKTFVGWASSRNGAVLYTGGGAISGNGIDNIAGTSFLPATNNDKEKSVSLYAIWIDSDFASNSNDFGSTWGSSSNPFVIKTAKHLQNLSDIVSGARDPYNSVTGTYYGESVSTYAKSVTFENCYFELGANIDMSGVGFVAIGAKTDANADAPTSTFCAVQFDFKGYNITNLTITSSGNDVGIFGYLKITKLKNTSENASTISGTISGASRVGILVGYTWAEISGKYIVNSNITGTGSFIGGVVGRNHGNIDNATFTHDGTVNGNSANSVGGIFGFTVGNLKNAVNRGSVTGGTATGGIVGRMQGTLDSCENNATVTSNATGVHTKKGGEVDGIGAAVGGITGYSNNIIKDCVNNGAVNASGNGVGGIVGISGLYNNGWKGSDVSDCTNTGAIAGVNYVGGLVGYAIGSISGTITNNSTVKGTDYVGGIVGEIANLNNTVLTYDWSATINITKSALKDNNGIWGRQYVGGAIGHLSSNVTITGTIVVCSAKNDSGHDLYDIDSNDFSDVNYLGGIVGYNDGTLDLKEGSVSVRILARGDGSYAGGIVGYNNGTINGTYEKSDGDVVSVNGGSYISGICGYNSSSGTLSGKFTHSSTTVSYNAVLYCTGSYVGGLVGKSEGVINVSEFSNAGTIKGANYAGSVGGEVIGNSANYCTIGKTSNTAEISATGNYVGGILGAGQYVKLTTSASNSGAISGKQYVGGLVGYAIGSAGSNNVWIYAGYNGGAISSDYSGSEGYIGGLVGYGQDTHYYNGATNDGTITAQNAGFVGGIVGFSFGGRQQDTTLVKNNKSVKGANNVGGIAGSINYGTFVNTENNGSVSGKENVGGIVGYFNTNGSISGTANNKNSVSGETYVGGIAGRYVGGTLTGKITNTGSVTASKSTVAVDTSYTIVASSSHTASGKEVIESIRDGDTSSKYCSGSVASASFVANVTAAGYLRGFVITNANDNSKYNARTVKIVKIWGSNISTSGHATGVGGATPTTSDWVLLYNNTNIGMSNNDYDVKSYDVGGVTETYKYYWVYLEGTNGALQLSEFDFTIEQLSPTYTGGIIGSAEGTSFEGAILENNGAVESKTGYFVGGIVGYTTDIMLSGASNSGVIKGKGSSSLGGVAGIIGGVAKGSNAIITKCANTGNVIAETANGVAGIIGRTEGGTTGTLAVSGCSNTGAITGFQNVGGIGGRMETTSSTSGALTFANCYNSATVTAVNNTVGGIVGYLCGNSNGSRVAVIKYCYNGGDVSSSDNKRYGAIVGNAVYSKSGSTTTTVVEYCYTTKNMPISEGDVEGLDNFNLASISNTNYVIVSGTTAPSVENGGSYIIYANSSLKPAVISGSSYTVKEWSDITSDDINGFKVYDATITPSTGQYFKTTNNAGAYVAPNKVENSNANAGVRENTEQQKITAWYTADKGNIACSVDSIAISNGSATYDGSQHGFDRNSVTNPSWTNYSVEYIYYGTNYKETYNTKPTHVDKYSVTVLVKIGSVVVGKKTYASYEITQGSLTITPTWSISTSDTGDTRNYTYNASKQGVLSFVISGFKNGETMSSVTASFPTNQNLDNAYSLVGNTYTLKDGFGVNAKTYSFTITITSRNYSTLSKTYTWTIKSFDLAVNGNAVIGGNGKLTLGNTVERKFEDKSYFELNNALIYTADNRYIKNNFVVYVKYNNGKVAELLLNDTNVLTASTSTSASGYTTTSEGLHCASGAPINVTLTATGKGNFTNAVAATYTAMISDFGGNYGQANWGSESNVFEISHPAHLIRLSEIVNGGKAWNSIRTTNTNICLTNNTSVASNITTRSYQNAYFKVMTAIDLTEYFNEGNGKSFTPIGNSLDHAFSGTFDGVSEARNIHLYINLTSDYVGLFGFVKGGTRTTTDNGYYMTPNGAIIKNVTVTGSVKGGSYVGGIVGVAGYVSIENCVNRASVDGISCVGGIVGMTGNIDKQVGWGRTATKLTNTGKITATGENVGGIVGYARDTTFSGNISNSGEIVGRQGAGGLLGVLCGGSIGNVQSQNAITNSGKVTGGNYVGGIAGRVTWASVCGTVSNSGQISGVACVGGIVGAFNSSIERNGTMSQDLTSRFNTTSATNNGAVDGSNYVGGIFGACYTGYTASNEAYAFSTGTVTNTKNVTGTGTGTYIGGIAGWLESSANTSDFVISTDNSNANIYIDTSTNITVTGKNCVGYLFGALVGNGYHGTSGASIATKLNIGSVFTGAVNGIDGGAVLGGLVGFMSKSVMMFSTNWNTNTISFGNMTNMSFVGGLVGMLGENGTIESAVTYDPNNGSFVTGGVHTITANTTFGSASNRLGNFVGGIVGYVTSSAGAYYGTNANVIGNTVALTNTGSIYGGSYVGGIFGAAGDFVQSDIYSNPTEKTINASYVLSLDAGVQGFIAELLWSGNFVGERSGNTLTLNPTANDTWHQVGENATLSAVKGKIINKANGDILGDSYVGGLIGYVGSNMMITFENAELSSTIENLSIYSTSGNNNGIVGTGDYIGGLIGFLSGEGHSLKNIVVRAHAGGSSAKYVGGIVGFMNSGTIENCVAMHTGDSISSDTSIWNGADYVGGLVGYTSTGIIRNSYTSGFKFANTSNTRGGLVGMGISATIEDSWAFYVASSGVDYSTISKNSYGKYIAVDDEFDVTLTLENIVAFVNNKQLAFEVTVPTNNKQLAFYDASGSDTVTNNIAENKEDSKFKDFSYANGKITIVLDAKRGYSMLVYTTPVKFVNVAQGNTGDTEKVRVAYRHPSSSEHYDAEVTSATFTDGVVTNVIANIYFNPYGNECVLVAGSTTSYAEDGKQVGAYNQTFVKGSEASPYTIGSWEEWQQFATSVKGGTSYSGLHISLTQSISGNATGYLAGDATHSFMGTFNGNGYTINIGNITSASDGTSLFPYANGATFKNLTITGSITSSHTGTAGFVGIANGSLTFENCTNQVSITSSGKNVGGILGQSHNNTSTYEFTDCVNEAKLVNSINSTVTGLGGIVGNIVTSGGDSPSLSDSNRYDQNSNVATVTFESCRNAGELKGTFNIAGIIGRNGGSTIIMNCGNTGNETGNGTSFSNPKIEDGANPTVGGICGLITTNATVNIYASYNSGNIMAWGNKAGGILAADSEYTSSSSTSNIYYCYNTGSVTVGGTRASDTTPNSFGWTTGDAFKDLGVNCGGIIGTALNVNIQYCYNTGKIVANGISGGIGEWKSRVGGIVGFADGSTEKNVHNCYNVGIIEVGSQTGSGDAKGAGPIIGATNNEDNIKHSNNYSVAQSVRVVSRSGDSNEYVDSLGNENKNWPKGNKVSSIDKMTAYMNSGGTMSMPNFVGQNVSSLDGDGIKQTNGGYVYVYGCLPQLAVFAVDTQNGLAMTSVAYGQNQYGDYEKQQAGGEFNPFVVKDGIDLLGLQSLVELGYDFSGKYIEFANSTNNLEGVQANNINYAAVDSALTDNNHAYMAYDGTKGAYIKGSSYHLLENGAVYKSYANWKENNHYYNVSTGACLSNGSFANQNMLSIGSDINTKQFRGHISGKQNSGSNTTLTHLRMSNGYVGLFDCVEDGYIGYININSAQLASRGVVGGIVARPRGSTTIENCSVDSSTIKSYNLGGSEQSMAAGGIAGYATTNSTKKGEYAQGATITIKNCSVSGSTTIEGYEKYVGGIIGMIYEAQGAKGKNNIVLIQGCSVNGATIKTTDGIGVKLGGVIGYGSENILTAIDGCTVGNSSAVSIEGKTDIGGIVGAASKVQGGYIKDCTVGANATITATADCSNIGGIVGSSDEGQSADSVTMTFQGTNTFGGTINLNNKKASNIGGVIGTMNRGASFFAGSVINVNEKTSGNIINPGSGSANIGGVTGLTTDAMFSGTFSVAPKMNTGIVDNVGGFIGKNTGESNILAEGTTITISGNISGATEVGGFIGINDSGASLVVGDDMVKGKPYTGELKITVNATINAGGNNVGGIVGKNEGSVSIVKGTISTSANSSFGGVNNVGGIIGFNDGNLATGGSTVANAELSITNNGSVSGTNYVGGVFGLLNKGTIAGSFTNGGSVKANSYFAGGVIGYLAKGASIGSKSNTTAITLTNSGSVSALSYAGGSIGYVEKGATIIANSNTAAKVTLTNSGSVGVTNYFAGGSIGILYGSIEGTASNRVLFSVAGTNASIAGKSYLGGSIGVIVGKIDYAQFTNSANLTINDGETAIGGSVGFVGKPAIDYVSAISNINNIDSGYKNLALGDIVISNSHFESTGSLTVNTTSAQAESSADDPTTSGGVGGAIGVVGGDVNLFNVQGWNKNTYYAMANVIAPSANNVGGVFGLVRADRFEISNMLAYQTTVQGNYNVGGIVGAITGTNVKISSSFALEGKFSGTSNVGGIVGLANDTTDASTAYWMLGLGNATLAGSNVNELSTRLGFNGSGDSLTYAIKSEGDAKIYTTGHSNTGWFFLYANNADGTDGMGTINVTHKEGETSGVSNSLAYWKYIAQAYSVGETVPATMTGSALTSNGTISANHVYATATAAPVANGGTGFYLYTQTSQEGTNPNITHYTTTDDKDAFYININTSQNVGNFVVYYRMITSGNALTYNGYQRIGVVGMDGVTIFTGDNILKHTFMENEREKYYFTTTTTETTESGQTTTTTPMTNAGTYSSNINIYYVDKDGNVYNVGGNSAMTWTINKRALSIVLNDGKQVNNRYYGQGWQNENSINYDMKFVISNIAPGQYNKEVCTITVNDFTFTVKINENGTEANVTYSGDKKGVSLTATVTTATDENPEDKTYIADGVDTSKGYYAKTLTCYLAFTIAMEYKVTINVSTNGTVQNYLLSQSEYKFGVNERALTVTPSSWTTGQTSTSPYTYVYNTKFQGLQTIGLDSGTSENTTGLVGEDKVTLMVTVTLDTGKEKFEVSDTTEAFGATDNANIVDIIKKIDKYGFVGIYTVKYEVGSDGDGKYSIPTNSAGNSDTWKITQYEVKFDGFSNMGTEKTYDGTAVVPILNISSIGVGNDNGIYTYGDDTFTVTYKVNNSTTAEKLVNAGTYNITIGTNNGAINASRKNDAGNKIGSTSENYKFGSSSSSTTYTIKPRSVALKWETTSSFVYQGYAQGLKVSGASSDEFTYSVNSGASLTSATLTVKKGGTTIDEIKLTYSGAETNFCTNKNMTYDSHKVTASYKHDGIAPIDGNYTFTNTESGKYSIVASNLKISGASASQISKEYNGLTDVKNGIISWTITNGNNTGKIPDKDQESESSYSYFKLTSKAYTSPNVGTNIGISVTISFVSSDKNYSGSSYTTTIYAGTITPKPVMIVLGLRNGKATKVYDGDAIYAGSISGNDTAGSRLGERFTVSGLLDNNVTISAEYKEAGNDRSFFDSYVNGVFKNADNTYSQESNKYYKKLVFTMSGDGANNYQFNVYNTSNQAYGKADGVGKDSTVTVYDSADDANRDNCGVAGGITIEITINSVRVNYSNTYQSYVDENGSYKEKWDRVTGTISGASNVVKVHNYWMYEDGIDDEKDEGYKKYTGYTVIKGSKNSKLLYAEVSPENGMQYNYRLSNQPTLTIAYFVSETGAFEIDSMSDLLIASFYYSASQNATAPEFVQIVKSGYKWIGLVSNEEYEADMATWDAEFEKHEGVFLNESSTEDGMKENWWGYYEATEDSTGKTIPSSFKLTKDIYGMLTNDDITKLNAFFTVAKSNDNGDITQISYGWGYGKTYLGNLLTAKEGSVVTLLGSLFVTDSGNTGFSGSFDGNGYVIEYLNIMGYEYNNVGLFDVIGDGTVEDLHLRNININANKGNVGGIAGQINNGANAVSNVSFHGSINVSGSGAVNVGGLFGQSARDISNSIVLGTINSSNTSAEVGGVVGSSSASISKVVSMMQINAKGTTGAFVGSGTNATNSFHMANAVYNGTSFVNAADSAKTYSELMNGSTSGYTTDNKYYKEDGDNTEAGTYDVLADVYYVEGRKDENARQSMRLYDIVSVYLLMYSLNTGKANVTDVGEVNVYTISSESWLVGSKHGTSAAGDAIVIANKQNVSLLRELRFATFTLASNIDVTISSTFSGAFYGTVNAGGYKITCNKDMFGVYLNDKSTWLAVSANS